MMTDWEVVVYGGWSDEDNDGPGRVIACWVIEDRTESEAFREAAADVQVLGSQVTDWTMEENSG
jgi:hypothetical protein